MIVYIAMSDDRIDGVYADLPSARKVGRYVLSQKLKYDRYVVGVKPNGTWFSLNRNYEINHGDNPIDIDIDDAVEQAKDHSFLGIGDCHAYWMY